MPAPDIRYGTEGLPAPVQDMREAILSAVKSGRIEELRHAWELNELKPDLGVASVGDPVAHWKQISGDGEGREILAALAEILDAGYVVLPLGRDLENNRLYVWPYFAEVPLDKLSPAQEVELLRLVSPAAAQGHAIGRQVYPLAHRHRRRRHVAFFPQGPVNSPGRSVFGYRPARARANLLYIHACETGPGGGLACGRVGKKGAGRGCVALDLQPC